MATGELDPSHYWMDIRDRITRLEEQVKLYAKTEWVTESINELTRTVDRMGLGVEEIGKQIATVTKGQEQLYKTHDALLRERAEYEKQQQENQNILLQKRLSEKSPANIAKRWLPFATLLTVIVVLFRAVGVLVDVWLTQIQTKH